jgi:hypothetical protein
MECSSLDEDVVDSDVSDDKGLTDHVAHLTSAWKPESGRVAAEVRKAGVRAERRGE